MQNYSGGKIKYKTPLGKRFFFPRGSLLPNKTNTEWHEMVPFLALSVRKKYNRTHKSIMGAHENRVYHRG